MFKRRLGLITMGNMTKNYDFRRFWAILPPEMTPVTPRWLRWKSKNCWKCLYWPISCEWCSWMMFKYHFGALFLTKFAKNVYFRPFSIQMYRKWGKMTSPVTPACSPGFPTLILHIQHSITIPVTYTKNGGWSICSTLKWHDRIGRASDRSKKNHYK